jgi:hypothetical protein
VLVLGACGGQPPPPPSPSAPRVSEPPDANPIAILHEGKARVNYDGDAQGRMNLQFELYNADPSFTAITWGSGFVTLDLYAGPGMITEGAHESGPDLGLQLRTDVSDTKAFHSGKRDCTITFTQVTEERVAGVIDCANLEALKGPNTIDLKGTFNAAH